MLAWTVVIAAWAAPTPPLADERAQIALAADLAVTPDIGREAGDREVEARLLGAYDADGNGVIGPEEVRRVHCAIWTALDTRVREVWGSGLAAVYGAWPDRAWAGGALGLADTSRAAWWSQLARCGFRAQAFGPEPVIADISGRLLTIDSADPERWAHAVRDRLVWQGDADASGWIDRGDEVANVPCAVWLALDVSLERAGLVGLDASYGFSAGLLWLGDSLGLSREVRYPLAQAIAACGLPVVQTRDWPTAPEAVAAEIAATPDAGSLAWRDRVREILVHAYDRDGTSHIQTVREVESISCRVWRSIEDALNDRGGSLVSDYGLDARFAWEAWRLGLSAAVRRTAFERLGDCERERPHEASRVSSTRRLTMAIGLSRWDLDRSGLVDTREEVAAVPCAVWGIFADEAAHDGESFAAYFGLGFARRFDDHGVGLARSVRGLVRRAANRCEHGEA